MLCSKLHRQKSLNLIIFLYIRPCRRGRGPRRAGILLFSSAQTAPPPWISPVDQLASFSFLDSYWRSPKPGDLGDKSRRFEEMICSPSRRPPPPMPFTWKGFGVLGIGVECAGFHSKRNFKWQRAPGHLAVVEAFAETVHPNNSGLIHSYGFQPQSLRDIREKTQQPLIRKKVKIVCSKRQN